MPKTRTPPDADPNAAGRARADGLLRRLEARDLALSATIATGWPHPRAITVPLGAISLTGNYGIAWYALAAVGAAAGPGGFSWRRFASVSGAVLATETVTYLVKIAVRRRRPPDRDPGGPEHIPLPLSPSFPSSHASMSTVGALTMSLYYPAWWPLFVLLALTLATSRVYLRVHYLADVLAGVALGLALGLPYVALLR
jgi:membrane-associated phospholipid phosphatase